MVDQVNEMSNDTDEDDEGEQKEEEDDDCPLFLFVVTKAATNLQNDSTSGSYWLMSEGIVIYAQSRVKSY